MLSVISLHLDGPPPEARSVISLNTDFSRLQRAEQSPPPVMRQHKVFRMFRVICHRQETVGSLLRLTRTI